MRRNAMGTLCIVTRTASRFVAVAGLLIAASACTSDETATGPQKLLEQPDKPVLDLQPATSGAFPSGYTFLPYTLDVGGPNDYNGQNDINQLSRADNDGKFGVAWTWDDINAWTGTGQSGDVCTLFDVDASGPGAGNADYALCVRISNPGGDPNVIAQLPAPESPILWECSDKKTDRCTTTIISKPLGNTFCEVLKTTTDAFPGLGDDAADVMAACAVDLTAIGTPSTIKLLNICSFPSGSPNSNPFDCILVAGSGYVKIVKKTTPQTSGQTFNFTLSPAASGGATNFSILDNSTADEATALIPVAAGTYSVTEGSLSAGWSLSAASCTGATANGSKVGNAVTGIQVGVGQTATCTFENTQSGSITIVKDANPNDAQDFEFTTDGAGLSSFILDDDDNATRQSTKVFTSLVTGGTRIITESAVTGWKVTNITCTGATTSTVLIGNDSDFDTNDNSVTIGLAGGENVSCTFENTKLGSITIVKDAVPDNDQDFSFTTTNLSPATFDLDDDGTGALPANSRVFSDLLPGTYGVAEDGETGWALTNVSCGGAPSATIGASSVSIALTAGENVTCTFTNTQGGSITIVKDALPNDAQDFAFTATNTDEANFTLDDDSDPTRSNSKVFSGLQPGVRTITEGLLPAWGKLTDITCGTTTNPVVIGAANGFDANDNSVTIDLAAGENVTCTFQNTKKPTVTVDKSANPTSIPETGGTVTYTVAVTNTTGYPVTLTTLTDDAISLDGVGTCDVPQSLAASGLGATYTCTFDRIFPPSAPGNHVNVVEATVSNGGGTGSDTDDATVTITDVLPAISVTKNAQLGTFTGVSGTLPESFLETLSDDRIFDSPPSEPPPGDPAFASFTCDDKGANDINSSQVDLNCFNRADNIFGKIYVRWTWDGTDDWGGGGSTGDACALMDTGTDGKADLAVCARITNATGPITQVPTAGAADVYTCNGTKAERCAGPTKVLTIDETECTIQANVANGFPTGDDGFDTQATCEIDLTMPGVTIPATTTLLNVCSFPSGEPNSNPFDCVVTVGSGFIQIVKTTNFTTSSLFGFTLGSNAAGFTSVNYAVQGGISSGFIPLAPTSGNTKYTLAETLPTTGWLFASATCKIGTNTVGTSSANGVINIVVESGKTTVCTFDNDGEVTGPVTYTVVVTNTGTVQATVVELDDDKFGNLLSFSDNQCSTASKVLAPAGTYTCVFTRTLTGAPGATHTNTVSAKAQDTQLNNATAQVSKTVTLPTP